MLEGFRVFFFVILLLFPILVAAQSNERDATGALTVLTEHWPPFNYIVDGKITGFGTEVVEATLNNAGIKYQLRSGVWKGVYDWALKEDNVLIYTISRTAIREDLFEWIGPFADRQQNFIKLKSRADIEVRSLEDAKRYRLGLQEEDAIAQDLFSWGFDRQSENLVLVNKRVLLFRMLFAGRIDLITGHDITVKYQLELEGLPYSEIEYVYPINVEGAYYMALKKGSDPELLRRLRDSFSALEQ
ncbi:hypothetical protein A3742_23200, partial [Oleiphilus sp. HI0071]